MLAVRPDNMFLARSASVHASYMCGNDVSIAPFELQQALFLFGSYTTIYPAIHRPIPFINPFPHEVITLVQKLTEVQADLYPKAVNLRMRYLAAVFEVSRKFRQHPRKDDAAQYFLALQYARYQVAFLNPNHNLYEDELLNGAALSPPDD